MDRISLIRNQTLTAAILKIYFEILFHKRKANRLETNRKKAKFVTCWKYNMAATAAIKTLIERPFNHKTSLEISRLIVDLKIN